jgi:hypothetical protein
MMGTRDSTTGSGVAWPRMSCERITLKAGSRVFTVWVREMATAAKDTLAATWPMACMEAGPKILPNSSLVTGCVGRGCGEGCVRGCAGVRGK